MKKRTGILLIAPLLLWLLFFLILPYTFILVQAFLSSDAFGRTVFHFNINSFTKLFSTSLYYTTLARTFLYALIVAAICVLISLPLTYFIAFKAKRNKQLLYSLIVLPFWISYIVRAYAWKIILGENGILNSFLMHTGLIRQPLSFLLYSNFSTIVCLIYILTPFVAIPVYTSFEQIQRTLIEASKDLGAGSFSTFRKIIFPLALPGIISGGTFALVLTMGDFLSPLLLGGPNTIFISNIVQNLFGTSNDKPLGSALGIVMLIVIVIVLEISSKAEKKYSSLKT